MNHTVNRSLVSVFIRIILISAANEHECFRPSLPSLERRQICLPCARFVSPAPLLVSRLLPGPSASLPGPSARLGSTRVTGTTRHAPPPDTFSEHRPGRGTDRQDIRRTCPARFGSVDGRHQSGHSRGSLRALLSLSCPCPDQCPFS